MSSCVICKGPCCQSGVPLPHGCVHVCASCDDGTLQVCTRPGVTQIGRWTEGVSLLVNAGPEDGLDHYDIWHTGGPGGPMLTAHSESSARAICDAIEELHQLRAENERVRQACLEMNAALSRIDYACGTPNEMGVSEYDLHCDPVLVVARVEALAASVQRLVQNAAARERVLNRQHDLLRKAERERDEALDTLKRNGLDK
jgi:hypothetical protein